LADLTPLSNSRSLRRLYLGGSRARDLTPVLELPKLEFVQNAMYAYINVAGKGAT
jgi:Leucine-rich repeat (LRR) protein